MGGGGGGGGGNPTTPNVPAAGPARPLSSYPQYQPLSYQGMTPGANAGIPGMGNPMQSYMPSVNGQMGFGGIPADMLIQALMAGYAGVPSATQSPGAGATVTPTPATATPSPATATAGSSRGSRALENIMRRYPGWIGADAVAGDGSGQSLRYDNYYSGGEAGTGGGNQGGSVESSSIGADAQASADNGTGQAGAGTDGTSGDPGGGMYARGGRVNAKALRGPNPPGPDDGYAGLDDGEYVVNAKQAKKHSGVLKQINAGRFGNKTHKGMR